MKQPIATCASIAGLMAIGTATSSAVVIAGWDTFDSASAPTATHLATSVTATTVATSSGSLGTGEGTSRGSSADGTWGTSSETPTPSTTAGTGTNQNWTVFNGATSAEITFTITNTGTTVYDLNAFHMDALAFRPSAPRTYALNVLTGSAITVGNVFTSATDAITSQGGTPPNFNSHDDIDISLTGLADRTLDPGEVAIIQIAFSDGSGSGGGHHLWVDNIAFTGSIVPVPEPSAALLGLLGTGFFFLRRRH